MPPVGTFWIPGVGFDILLHMNILSKKNKIPWYVAGLAFECQQCGGCCSGPAEGFVWATDAEIAAVAGTLLGGSASVVIEQPWREETAEIFIEAFPAQSRLFIVGATHTAIPLCRIAKELGFEVHIEELHPEEVTRRARQLPWGAR